MKKKKTLGQIAYESVKDGGQQNFGPWNKAPEVVRDIHERMACAIRRRILSEYKRRIAVPIDPNYEFGQRISEAVVWLVLGAVSTITIQLIIAIIEL